MESRGISSEEYLDKEGFQILSKNLYYKRGGQYFIPVERPSKFHSVWYFFKLDGTNKGFTPDETRELSLVDDKEKVKNHLSKMLENLEDIEFPSEELILQRRKISDVKMGKKLDSICNQLS